MSRSRSFSRVASVAAGALAVTAGMLMAGGNPAAANAGAGASAVTALAAYCPDHPNVPEIFPGIPYTPYSSYINANGQGVDLYRIPDRYGFRFVTIVCDL